METEPVITVRELASMPVQMGYASDELIGWSVKAVANLCLYEMTGIRRYYELFKQCWARAQLVSSTLLKKEMER